MSIDWDNEYEMNVWFNIQFAIMICVGLFALICWVMGIWD